MVEIHGPALRVDVPDWVTDINSFRRWLAEDNLPDEAKVWWLKGRVWVDMSGEQMFTHVRVKTVISTALDSLAEREELGMYFTDGVLLSNFAADISGKPDGLFLTNDTLASDRIRLIEGKEGGVVELQGSPDMVLEILSKSSEEKDTVTLMQAYWEAEVREYWVVDARADPLLFDVYRHGPGGYTRTRKQGGWVKSNVFGKSFRLVPKARVQGHPNYALEVR
jgi:Uma2 family endonuclease